MIGDGWDGEPSTRPEAPIDLAPASGRRRILVVTGTRAEFGLLAPVMRAIRRHEKLELLVVAAGAHMILPAETYREVKAAFPVADIVPMQTAGRTGRFEDAEALGKGVARFARSFQRLAPDAVLVLGDRIEAFAAAAAASVAGIPLAHVHAGDRAEGVADEAMRHAITKLAHIHFPATPASAERLTKMGERPAMIHTVGSPALDGLDAIEPLSDGAFADLGSPGVVLLFHPIGRSPEIEEAAATEIIAGFAGERVLALHPNFDPGREGILRAIRAASLRELDHLPRDRFIALLKRLRIARGVLVGNSSAALIEGAALKLPAIDAGPRQGGRERCANVLHLDRESAPAIRDALAKARTLDLSRLRHPYGEGDTGPRIAALLAGLELSDPSLLRKRCTY